MIRKHGLDALETERGLCRNKPRRRGQPGEEGAALLAGSPPLGDFKEQRSGKKCRPGGSGLLTQHVLCAKLSLPV